MPCGLVDIRTRFIIFRAEELATLRTQDALRPAPSAETHLGIGPYFESRPDCDVQRDTSALTRCFLSESYEG
jgi:hypothetical protein